MRYYYCRNCKQFLTEEHLEYYVESMRKKNYIEYMRCDDYNAHELSFFIEGTPYNKSIYDYCYEQLESNEEEQDQLIESYEQGLKKNKK